MLQPPGVADDALDAPTLHQALVDQLVEGGMIKSAAVEAAFRVVPRHPFLPGESLDRVYRDEPIVTKRREDGVPISSSSQPAAMAIMLEQLGVRPGHRVLEIGAGTGYNAALLARLAGPDGLVVSLDIDEDIVGNAAKHLAAAAIPESARVELIQADGGHGWPAGRPYDRIILTVGAWDIAPPWVDQLAPTGRLLIPLWLRGTQRTVAFERGGDHLKSLSLTNCAFMRLRGAFAGPEGFVALGPPEDGLTLSLDDQTSVDPGTINALLASSGRDQPTGIAVPQGREAWSGLSLWLALRETGFCLVHTERDATVIPIVMREWSATLGLVEPDAIALLALADASQPDQPVRLMARSYGPRHDLAERLANEVIAWDHAGRPDDAGLQIDAYPIDQPVSARPGATTITKRWHQFVVTWRARSSVP